MLKGDRFYLSSNSFTEDIPVVIAFKVAGVLQCDRACVGSGAAARGLHRDSAVRGAGDEHGERPGDRAARGLRGAAWLSSGGMLRHWLQARFAEAMVCSLEEASANQIYSTAQVGPCWLSCRRCESCCVAACQALEYIGNRVKTWRPMHGGVRKVAVARCPIEMPHHPTEAPPGGSQARPKEDDAMDVMADKVLAHVSTRSPLKRAMPRAFRHFRLFFSGIHSDGPLKAP